MSAALDDLTPDVDVIIVQPGRCSGGASHPAVLFLTRIISCMKTSVTVH